MTGGGSCSFTLSLLGFSLFALDIARSQRRTMYALLKQLILPPGVFFVGLALGFVLWRIQLRQIGKGVAVTAAVGLYLFSTPFFSNGLIWITEMSVEPFDEPGEAGAIVVLAAGIRPKAKDFDGRSVVDALTFERLRYGAYLHRETNLPILVSGGPWSGSGIVTADLMQSALKDSFGVEARWVERRSTITRKNATYSSRMLQAEGIDTIVLVTHGWHMPRAKAAFERRGLKVVQGPTGLEKPIRLTFGAVLPQGQSMQRSYFACHEMLGRVWYWLRG